MVDESAPPSAVPPAEAWVAAADTGRALRDAGEAARVALHAATVGRLSAPLLQQLIDHARDGHPNEACGIIAGKAPAEAGGRATRFLPLRNAAESPYRYLIDPDEQLRAMLEIDDADEVVWGIFHSHVASPAEPSVTDIGLAYYPDSLYLICSLAGDVPTVRAWSIVEGRVAAVALEVG